MKEPFISICMINFNGEEFVRESVVSVLAQTYNNFELIIVDNASTDSSVKIIEDYNDSRIKLHLNEEQKGFYQNINNAISKSKGEFFTVISSKDSYMPTFLSEIANAYEKYPTKSIFITGFYQKEDKKTLPCFPLGLGGLKTGQEIITKIIEDHNIGCGNNFVYQKCCLSTIGVFSEGYKQASNYEYWIKLSKLYDFIYIPEPLVFSRKIKTEFFYHVSNSILELREKLEIINNKLLKGNYFDEQNIKKVDFIYTASQIKRAFYEGLKYKSGRYTRKNLKVFKKQFPVHKFNPYWHFVYLVSYLIDSSNNLTRNALIYLIESFFYPYDKICEYNRKTLVMKHQLSKQQHKIKGCSYKHSSCCASCR